MAKSDTDSNDQKEQGIEAPPTTIIGILKRLGPGLIVAGSIVGSGELIATTATGAQAGFVLLWLIIVGCVIKVFCQVEMGRYAITEGKTTMEGLAEVPGPAIKGRGNWLVWYWFVMFLASIAQLGGIVGGVGQALAISCPVTETGRDYNEYAKAQTALQVTAAEAMRKEQPADSATEVWKRATETLASLETMKQKEYDSLLESSVETPENTDHEEQLRAELKVLKNNAATMSGGKTKVVPQIQVLADVLDRLKNEEKQDQEDSPDASSTKTRLQIVDLSLAICQGLQAEYAAESRESKTLQLLIAWIKRIQKTGDTDPVALKNEVAELITESENLSLHRIDTIHSYLAFQAITPPSAPPDDKIWATIIAIATAFILFWGRYGLIQSFSTVMVALFTLITVVNLFLLQSFPSWQVSPSDIWLGLQFRLGDSSTAIATALFTFGIIGVGASELITYPYWCLEKGYARYTGPREDSVEWVSRASGWLRVMRWDSWCSMVVYTFATIAFYLLGAAILHPTGLAPEGHNMIRHLAVMYEPAFGRIAGVVFLFGAFAVLYSTFFVANASHARVFSDTMRVLGLAKSTPESHLKRVKLLSAIFPLMCLAVYLWSGKPTQLVLLSGLMQAAMLPMLAVASLYFRYRRSDRRICPGKTWDVFLWLSAIGMSIAGLSAAWVKIASVLW